MAGRCLWARSDNLAQDVAVGVPHLVAEDDQAYQDDDHDQAHDEAIRHHRLASLWGGRSASTHELWWRWDPTWAWHRSKHRRPNVRGTLRLTAGHWPVARKLRLRPLERGLAWPPAALERALPPKAAPADGAARLGATLPTDSGACQPGRRVPTRRGPSSSTTWTALRGAFRWRRGLSGGGSLPAPPLRPCRARCASPRWASSGQPRWWRGRHWTAWP